MKKLCKSCAYDCGFLQSKGEECSLYKNKKDFKGCDTCAIGIDDEVPSMECINRDFDDEGFCNEYVKYIITLCDSCDRGCKLAHNICEHYLKSDMGMGCA